MCFLQNKSSKHPSMRLSAFVVIIFYYSIRYITIKQKPQFFAISIKIEI